MKFAAVIFVALFVSINAYPYAVIEVAKVASPVGSHGPALINLHWPNSWPGSYSLGGKGHSGGSGSWGGSSGYGSSEGWGNGGSVGYTGDAGHGHDGKYVAINRGAIHVADLVGHTQSVKSQNYQPAPGTTW
ncbi:heterogeneous nuclear ribonucleoprotein A3 homolog 1-like [Sitodiplosis mosellana]|uniref:heterogeneous nuclear ribonucleoprotein A3 homolog 1-like n=1 Tax=Sitodiplosis mosellana TaxID=263140 RepID=UPI0024439524|nr:heterogeneous nuclear ribonucleoprotein A3 homolog 1-like [Sitodiplosis mosellana]